MSRVLLAWELGANFGHLSQLAAIARALRAAGHETVFAVRDLQSAAEFPGLAGYAFTQAPRTWQRRRAAAPPANFAEMLALEGYSDPATAAGLIAGWVTLVRVCRVDAIAADYAPGALVAGRILGLPAAQVGTGFCIPPLASPMPSIRPWEVIPEARLARSEQQLTALLNRILRPYRGPELGSLSELFRTAARLLATFPALDPFGPRPGERYVGPIFEHESGDRMDWPNAGRPRILAYLRPGMPGAGDILKALKSAPAASLCVVPGVRPTVVQELESERLRIAARLVRLRPLLQDADLALVYGGHGTLCAALAAGVPVLAIPHTVEQYLHSTRAEAAGVAVVVKGERAVASIAARIGQVLADAGLKTRAREFAARAGPFDPAGAAATAAHAIEVMTGGRAREASGRVSQEPGVVR